MVTTSPCFRSSSSPWSCQSHHPRTRTRCLGRHHPRQIHPGLSAHRSQCERSACGCASTNGNDDHHWNMKARAVGRQACPPNRPSSLTLRHLALVSNGMQTNCAQQEATGDHEPQTHVHCARLVHVRGTSRSCQDTISSSTPSEMQIRDSSPRECTPTSPNKTTSLATERSLTSSSETSGEQSPSGTQVEGGADCDFSTNQRHN